MKNCLRYLAFVVFDECHLRVGGAEEEVRLGFRKDFSFILTGWLNEEFVAFASEDQTEARHQLIFAYVSVKDFRIDSAGAAALRSA